MTARALIESARSDPMQRLRWIVLRAFNVLPCSEEAGKMSDELCLAYAAQLVLDRRGGADNPGFDEDRFAKMKEECR